MTYILLLLTLLLQSCFVITSEEKFFHNDRHARYSDEIILESRDFSVDYPELLDGFLLAHNAKDDFNNLMHRSLQGYYPYEVIKNEKGIEVSRLDYALTSVQKVIQKSYAELIEDILDVHNSLNKIQKQRRYVYFKKYDFVLKDAVFNKEEIYKPLQNLIELGERERFQALINIGFNVNQYIENSIVFGQCTPLICAIIKKRSDMIDFFIEQEDIDINKSTGDYLSRSNYSYCSKKGETPLHCFIGWYVSDPDKDLLFDRIIRHPDIDIDKKDSHGNSPSFYAVQSDKNFTLLEKLLKAGVDVSQRDQYDRTLLHAAAWYRAPQNFKLLLRYGFDRKEALLLLHCFSDTALQECLDAVKKTRDIVYLEDINLQEKLNH